MIETIELINWKEVLKSRTWYKELREKIKNDEFRLPETYFENGVSKAVYQSIQEFEDSIQEAEELVNIIGWINARVREQTKVKNYLHFPYNSSTEAWIKINNLILCLEFVDEYHGGGMIEFGCFVRYLDKQGDDETWIKIFNDLTKIARGEEFIGFDNDFCPSEYC